MDVKYVVRLYDDSLGYRTVITEDEFCDVFCAINFKEGNNTQYYDYYYMIEVEYLK